MEPVISHFQAPAKKGLGHSDIREPSQGMLPRGNGAWLQVSEWDLKRNGRRVSIESLLGGSTAKAEGLQVRERNRKESSMAGVSLWTI